MPPSTGLPTGSTQGSGDAGSAGPQAAQLPATVWDALNAVLKAGGSVNININLGPTPTVTSQA